MKRKIGKIKLAIIIGSLVCVVAAAITLPLVFTNKEDAAADDTQQTYTVATGDISNEITAAGNLALSKTEDVAFEMSGTVLEVLVSAGDIVAEGQVLARLDTTDLEDQLKTLEKSIVTAERNVTAKEAALAKVERTLTAQQRQVSVKQFAVTEADLAVQSAENDLDNINAVADAKTAVDEAQTNLDICTFVIHNLIGGGLSYADYAYWANLKIQAVQELADAEAALQDVIDLKGVNLSSNVKLQIIQAKLNIEKKKLALEDARIAVSDAEYAVFEAQTAVKNAQYDVDDAKSALEEAGENLEEAQNQSAVITAPFDGFIPSISIKGGDEVMKGTVAMKIADPDQFEVVMSVSEEDIASIEVGGKAYVTVDALDITLPADVTYIAPTATISSGVVNYSVTVQVQSIEDYIAEMKETIKEQMQSRQSDNSDTGMQAPSGDMPAMSGNITMPEGMSGRTFGSNLENIELRQGLTVTISLVISEATDVILVPYTAVTSQGPVQYVEILKDDGTTEKRTVTTGITDYSSYEITSGLAEGEIIVITAATAASASTANSRQGFGQGGFFFAERSERSAPAGGPPGGQ